jgi:hypothetical protein
MRWFASGAVSPDGTEALVAGVDLTCEKVSLSDCPMPMWRIDASTGNVTLARGGSDGAAHYHARYLADGRVALQTTALSGCTGVNSCRHDIIAVPRSDLAAPGAVLRRDAYGPAFDASGTAMAFLVYDEPETHCKALPCLTANLYVAPVAGGAPRRVAAGEVAHLNAQAMTGDGKWVQFGTEHEGRVCRSDGARCTSMGWVRMLGWVK